MSACQRLTASGCKPETGSHLKVFEIGTPALPGELGVRRATKERADEEARERDARVRAEDDVVFGEGQRGTSIHAQDAVRFT